MKEEQKKPTLKEEFQAINKKSNIIRLASMMKPYVGKLLLCAVFVLIVNAAELLKPMIPVSPVRFEGAATQRRP